MAISSASVGGQFTGNRPDLSGIQAGLNQRRLDTANSVTPLLNKYGEEGLAAMAIEGNQQAQRYFRQRGLDPNSYVSPVWEWEEPAVDDQGNPILNSDGTPAVNVRRSDTQAGAPADARQTWNAPTWDQNRRFSFEADRATWSVGGQGQAPPTQETETPAVQVDQNTKTWTRTKEVPQQQEEEEAVEETAPTPTPTPTPEPEPEPEFDPGVITEGLIGSVPQEEPEVDAVSGAAPDVDPGTINYAELGFPFSNGQRGGSGILFGNPESAGKLPANGGGAVVNAQRFSDALAETMMAYASGQPYTRPGRPGLDAQGLRTMIPLSDVEMSRLYQQWVRDQQQKVNDIQRLQALEASRMGAPQRPPIPQANGTTAPVPQNIPRGGTQPSTFMDEFGNLAPASGAPLDRQLPPDQSAAPKDFRVGAPVEGVSMVDTMGPTEEDAATAASAYSTAMQNYRRTRDLPANHPDRQAAEADLQNARTNLQNVQQELGVSRLQATLAGDEVVDVQLSPEAATLLAEMPEREVTAMYERTRTMLAESGVTFDEGDVGASVNAVAESLGSGTAVVETQDSRTGKPVTVMGVGGQSVVVEGEDNRRKAGFIHAAVTDPQSGRGQHGTRFVTKTVERTNQQVREDLRANPERATEIRQSIMNYTSDSPTLNFMSRMIQERPEEAVMFFEESTNAYLSALETQASIQQAESAARYSEALAGAQEQQNAMGELTTEDGTPYAEALAREQLRALKFENDRNARTWEILGDPGLEAQLQILEDEAGISGLNLEFARQLLNLQVAMGYSEIALNEAYAKAQSGGGEDPILNVLKTLMQYGDLPEHAPDLFASIVSLYSSILTPTDANGNPLFEPTQYEVNEPQWWHNLPFFKNVNRPVITPVKPSGGVPGGGTSSGESGANQDLVNKYGG